ncbi:unnamed protein product [Pleuronectes platessa]|uniref:Costars family protein ABRACL n=1 Tax=Pleuronectes platessa TaxID=8262 RepID=A0A9N7TJ14_PLEPL|nr:unnamed protein product [Pleuronectes platessa]
MMNKQKQIDADTSGRKGDRSFQPKQVTQEPATMNVAHEIDLLVQEIQRLGSKNDLGQTTVKFGVLFSDDRCANIFEALVGTLRAAKRKKIISFEGELLLQGVHDQTSDSIHVWFADGPKKNLVKSREGA